MHLLTTLSIFLLPTLILSHGIVISPPPRAPGPASLSACGKSITEIIKSDNQSGIEVLHKASVNSKDYNPSKCNILLCKGLQLEDNTKNVQHWVPGQKVKLSIWTRIPHIGWWSVGIVDSQSMLLVGGEALKTGETGSVSGFEVPGEHEGIYDDEMDEEMMIDFEIDFEIPKVFPRCVNPGDCVLQWTWFGRVVKQTYESCIDFVVTPESYSVDDGGDELESQKPISD
ncbi:uncharacterized protein PAC_09398 [Phialocephala subalpina]|uniref:Chitin-binding type-4 domain-containing protein n=1 Tax=Phialocephala subalpina TaxID=576137 RepID=A0A1L7X3D8_9HELO|nr:uncharacterized protein PAC_09398 [Phialocephala subalpina]